MKTIYEIPQATDKQIENCRTRVEGKSFFKFQVTAGRVVGGHYLTVSTSNTNYTPEEAREMLIYLLLD